jgi:hypothetical protein
MRLLPCLLPLVLVVSWQTAARGQAERPPPDDLPPPSVCLVASAPSPWAVLWTGWDVEVEYLLWFLREDYIPPLLTTGTPVSGGVLGHPQTRLLYGDERLETRHSDRFCGTRFRLAKWLDPHQLFGLEGRCIFLERDSTHFKAVSDGDLLLARPFLDARTGVPSSVIIAGPGPDGPRSGAFVGYTRVEFFSEEANALCALYRSPLAELDLIVGARFLQLRDRADMTAAARTLPERTTAYGLEDHYRTHNAFYGGQLGLKGDVGWGPLFVGFRGTAALGADAQIIRAWGYRVTHTPAGRDVLPVGLTVQPGNTGRFEDTVLDWVLDVGVNVGCQLTPHCRAFMGYTFLYWNNPIRSGRQIDLTVNPDAAVVADRPGIPFAKEAFWGQGLNWGLEFTW